MDREYTRSVRQYLCAGEHQWFSPFDDPGMWQTTLGRAVLTPRRSAGAGIPSGTP